jgi:hypothetical protein
MIVTQLHYNLWELKLGMLHQDNPNGWNFEKMNVLRQNFASSEKNKRAKD